ncbi:hypothetical protein C7974DRAFT_368938 [Boeremia exigua]|uniref:uncharacterized protein n=1 Tax=Boeremia exigua TaxID=749465 RepID=UPI001E8DE005|nr:uncharacterized protein C7974DRAFT_368938 [Boeremia exigua]KAH6613149.1 hypothetical protein C7974DRAFT_368938 [Boeremia exigua]
MELPPPDLVIAYQSGLSLPHAGHNNATAQQHAASYGFDQSLGPIWQAGLTGEQLAMTEYQHRDLQPFTRTSISQPGHVLLDVMPVGDPARPRKRKAATLREEDWEPYKERILDLHVVQKIPLPKVRQMMEEEYGFKAELRQYRSRISLWGKDKNVKLQEMQAIVRKRQRRKLVDKHKSPLAFEVRGSQVDPHKVERWMKRHKVPDSLLYEPIPAASTPPDVGCRTISMPGSPAMSVISVRSAAASIWSLTDRYDRSQTPRMSLPTLSVSSIVRSRSSGFDGQSPTLTHRSPPSLQISLFHDSNACGSTVHVEIQSRYKQDEEERLRDTLFVAELMFLCDPSEILDTLFDLGYVLLAQGRYKAAEDVAHKLIDSQQSPSGGSGKNTEILDALILFSEVLGHQGRYAKAEEVLRHIIPGRNWLAHQYGMKVACLFNLGWVLTQQGQNEEGEAVLRQAVEIGAEMLGPEDIRTLNSISALADFMEQIGRLTEAEAMHRETLATEKAILGLEHANTLSSMSSLADVLDSQGKDIEAEELYRETIALKKKVLGPEHPDTLVTTNNLAVLLQDQGLYKEAEELYKETMALRKRALGLKHPETLTSMQNLAYLLHLRGRYHEAEELYRETIALNMRVLGLEDPRTQKCMESLEEMLTEQGRYDEMVPYIE